MRKSANSSTYGSTMASGALGLLVASSIGAMLGVLFAPKAGIEMRGDLAERARQLAWRFKRSRAELQESVRDVFGKITDELERAYLEVRGDVMARMDELEPGTDAEAAYKKIVRSAVMAAAKGRRWSKAQIERFVKHLEQEYEVDVDENA